VEIVKLLIEHRANATAKDNVRGTCEVVLEHLSEILSKHLPTLEKINTAKTISLVFKYLLYTKTDFLFLAAIFQQGISFCY